MGSQPRLGGFTWQSNTEGKLSKGYVQVDSMCREEVGKKVAVVVIATSVDVDPDWLTRVEKSKSRGQPHQRRASLSGGFIRT